MNFYSNSRFYKNYKQTRPEKPLIFSELITEDLENKRPYSANWDTPCGKCGKIIAKFYDFYYYGKSRKICLGCHSEAIDWMKSYVF